MKFGLERDWEGGGGLVLVVVMRDLILDSSTKSLIQVPFYFQIPHLCCIKKSDCLSNYIAFKFK